MSPSRDELAAALGRARTSHEKRPGDARLELLFERARAEYLQAELEAREDELRRERRRFAAVRADIARIKRDFEARAAALVRRARPMRRKAHDAGAPLFGEIAA